MAEPESDGLVISGDGAAGRSSMGGGSAVFVAGRGRSSRPPLERSLLAVRPAADMERIDFRGDFVAVNFALAALLPRAPQPFVQADGTFAGGT